MYLFHLYLHYNISLGILRIGGIALGGGLFVGNTLSNMDQIFLNIWDEDEGTIKLANNIFEFAKGLILTPDDEDLMGKITHSQLYKNWGEDFWRVREE